MRILFLALALMCSGMFNVQHASAARSEGIAVVVNEGAITMSDVNDRMTLIMASSGLPDKPEIREKLMPQILGSLIDEQIRLQEAKKLDIAVPREEINEGFATIAGQNNQEPAQFREMLTRGGINVGTMDSQIEAQIAWGKVVAAKLRPKVIVTDNDIDSYMARLRKNIGTNEYLVGEIFLPVEKPQEDAQTRDLAQKLVQEMRQGKAPFFKLAQQFSKSAGAAQGGDLGWVSQGQLQKELDGVLPSVAQDNVSDPVRSTSGYHILNVREIRAVAEDTLPAREDVMRMIGLQRLERLQRRYLLDVKSASFIDNRLEQVSQ